MALSRVLSRSNILQKRTQSLLPVLIYSEHSSHRSQVNISHCIYGYKNVGKYTKFTDLHNTLCPRSPFSTSVGTKEPDNLHDTEDQKQMRYVFIDQLPFDSTAKDIVDIFKDVDMVDKPHIIRLENGTHTGSVLLKVADSANVKLCFEKLDSNLTGRKLYGQEMDEETAQGFLGKTVIKVSRLPTEWGINKISRFLSDSLTPINGYKKIKKLAFPQPSIPENKSGGRVYLTFKDHETTKAAKWLLTGKQVPFGDGKMRHVAVIESNSREVFVDIRRSRNNRKKNLMKKESND